MNRLMSLALVLAAAGTVQAASVQRVSPNSTALSVRFTPQLQTELPVLDAEGTPSVHGLAAGKAGVVLNCENDNTLDPASTLILEAGDLAGTIFVVPTTPSPYRVSAVNLGVFSFNAAVPAQVDLVLLEDDGTGMTFNSIGSFTVDVDTAVDPAGEILDVDLSEFDITGENDLLVLYGDAAGAANALLLPAGDSSPRCYAASGGTDNVCSVHLPSGSGTLFIYGAIDGTQCPSDPSHILNLDIVVEVVLDPVQVATEQSSFGAVKARF